MFMFASRRARDPPRRNKSSRCTYWFITKLDSNDLTIKLCFATPTRVQSPLLSYKILRETRTLQTWPDVLIKSATLPFGIYFKSNPNLSEDLSPSPFGDTNFSTKYSFQSSKYRQRISQSTDLIFKLRNWLKQEEEERVQNEKILIKINERFKQNL